ncbi:hypothetical protein I5R65_07580 [Herbaspirillum sp. AP02]|uniref:hypothetical protein n=1 Tax=unclassified Herbaspirillum TaxID=2624150 RepID=UPI0015D98184|nr:MULTISPECIES: hypothetical protein [unclassified Herbaspirillum]MBG7619320.1 hypothetical protein [Herbaspirillum sp. AP02]NZD66604.1 hypothetical protein [Herbaspirillum sp. AP21]
MKTSAAILSHPAFDRPKVVNPVFRGKKKGCISLGTERRRRRAIALWALRASAISLGAEK